ncbi:pilus assembly protein TadG-related protein [Kineococcus sp. SYSU DK006]|uniref:pilus assembly protein TadG-related protein n=1 Tax=Kineococcus sp. SYSU DK006 TaxID=3383127 RepID=UPI003D7ECCF0
MSTAGPRDEGRIALLSLGFALVAVLLVLALASASAVHLQRKRLVALADAAAADAADAVDERVYYGASSATGGGAGGAGGAGGRVLLSDGSVRASAEDYLRRHGDLPGAFVAPGTGTSDGRTAEVVLAVRVRPPFADVVPGAPGADGLLLRARSRAVAVLR